MDVIGDLLQLRIVGGGLWARGWASGLGGCTAWRGCGLEEIGPGGASGLGECLGPGGDLCLEVLGPWGGECCEWKR